MFPFSLSSAKRSFLELLVHAERFAQTCWEEVPGMNGRNMGEICCLLERSCHCAVPLTCQEGEQENCLKIKFWPRLNLSVKSSLGLNIGAAFWVT